MKDGASVVVVFARLRPPLGVLDVMTDSTLLGRRELPAEESSFFFLPGPSHDDGTIRDTTDCLDIMEALSE